MLNPAYLATKATCVQLACTPYSASSGWYKEREWRRKDATAGLPSTPSTSTRSRAFSFARLRNPFRPLKPNAIGSKFRTPLLLGLANHGSLGQREEYDLFAGDRADIVMHAKDRDFGDFLHHRLH
jgi:hypothetical protein